MSEGMEAPITREELARMPDAEVNRLAAELRGGSPREPWNPCEDLNQARELALHVGESYDFSETKGKLCRATVWRNSSALWPSENANPARALTEAAILAAQEGR